MRTCWIVESATADGTTEAISQLAQMRGLLVQRSRRLEPWSIAGAGANRCLVALDAQSFARITCAQSDWLCRQLTAGLTLYVHSFSPGASYNLAPFRPGHLNVTAGPHGRGLHFTTDGVLPRALRGLRCDGQSSGYTATAVNGEAHTIAYQVGSDGTERSVLLGLRLGGGQIIYDLQSAPCRDLETPILWRMANSSHRCRLAGMLAAVDRAAGRDPELGSAVNLVIDDRPANLDFRVAATRRWLDHVNAIFPSIHIDLAWTPSQTRPSHRYIELLKRYSIGFVWHGFHQHVDHRRLRNLAEELARGRHLVEEIQRRYRVRFQPVMVFPYERANPEAIRQLKQTGFVASAEYPGARAEFEAHLPNYLRYSTPFQALYSDYFPILRRYPQAALDRERMLAMAALGLPIIATAHPKDLALRRIPGRPGYQGSITYFDEVLRFAADHKLRPLPLEEIAAELTGGPGITAPLPIGGDVIEPFDDESRASIGQH